MKFLLPIAALMLAIPVSAGEILPNLYAQEFCSLRSMGVSKDEAITAATEVAYLDNGRDMPQVTIGGKKYEVDVIRAYRAISERCPEYL